MALNTLNTDSISFKKLIGKSHTQQGFSINEEGINSNVQQSFTTVFANKIEPLPVTNSGFTGLYNTNGIVERIRFQVDIIPDTQIAVGRSQGYRLKLPIDYNANGELFPIFSAGTYLYNSLGKLQIVPSIYGKLKNDGTTEYDPILYQTNGSTVIPKYDPINWYLDTYNGILFVQDPPVNYDTSATRPGYVEAFLYIGDYIDNLLFKVGNGNTGTTGTNVGGGVGIFKDKIITTGGTAVLRYKSLYGTNGISITSDSDNVFVNFNINVNNGLTKSGNNIKLGGNLTGDTTIGLGINSLTFTGTTGTLKYGSDLSSQYTTRSLVDKGYVTGLTSTLNTVNGVNVTTTYTANTISNFIGISGNTPLTVYLPLSPLNYQKITITDIKGNGLTNNITINGNGKLINGSSLALINTDYGSFTLIYNNTSWSIISFI